MLATEPSLWLQYAEIELKGGFVNHALNVLHRAVEILPRRDVLWFRYCLYQESTGDEDKTRAVFEKWMSWEPKEEEPWFAFASFEERHGQLERARDVYERYCGTHAYARAYIKYAKWEDAKGSSEHARQVFERAVGAAQEENQATHIPSLPELPAKELALPDVWLAFAQFEAKQKEPERARAVFEFALTQVNEQSKGEVYAQYASFEKRLRDFDGGGAESIVALRRRHEYEQVLKEDPRDYDTWLDLCRLEETSQSNVEHVRACYKRAQHVLPQDITPSSKAKDRRMLDKRLWGRYVYLFIYHAIFEESVAKDVEHAKSVYEECLKVLPHQVFTFAKVWILYANFLLRNGKQLGECRKLLGRAIGMCPKDKLFRFYIQLELQLGQVDRCRILYEKYLVWNPTNSQVWSKYAEMEHAVGETNRARSLFELAISQPVLDEPEKLWLRYIDFEVKLDEQDNNEEDEPQTTGKERARLLYQRLLDRTERRVAKVWIAYAKFSALVLNQLPQAREILGQAETFLKPLLPDQRALVLHAWLELEQQALKEQDPHSGQDLVQQAIDRIPNKVERRNENGSTTVEWLFPQDLRAQAEAEAKTEEAKSKLATLNMLQRAEEWKKKRLKQ